jgi:hypothetical protein
MDIETLTSFFMWCTLLNMGMLLFWTVMCVFAPDLIFNLHHRWFSLSRESFNVVIYALLGLFKILVLFFNVVPFVVLWMIGS